MTMTTARLTPEQFEELGRELDAVRKDVVDDLGQADADYIRTVVTVQRRLEIAGRGLLFLGFLPPAWLAGVAALAASKILDNMEIGHNVLHGQYDWMGDPRLNSKMFEWDIVSPSQNWLHSHNYIHHTFTNIIGKDRDVGYSILRIDPAQRWTPYHLGNPVYALLLSLVFEWGVALHDLEAEKLLSGEKTWADTNGVRRRILQKSGKQVLKDYLLFPALTGPLFLSTLLGNATANVARNVWAFAIIFCGHFPDGVESFTEEDTANETRGQWYYRQMLGSANITGGRLFHLLSGNLSHQIEHHLFPDVPARRYAQIAPQVREICRRFELPYNTGSLSRQLGTVFRKLCKLAVPDGRPGAAVSPR